MSKIISVNRSPFHTLSKPSQNSIVLLEGLGVEGDAHNGKTVKHRSRVKADPKQSNLRQVHLIHNELLEELREKGFVISPGEMGENVTTIGIELLALPKGTNLFLGKNAMIEITGLRNPCVQLESIQPGLMKAVLDKDNDDKLIRKAGIMGIVLKSGEVFPGDIIGVELPPQPHLPLEKV